MNQWDKILYTGIGTGILISTYYYINKDIEIDFNDLEGLLISGNINKL